jgi:uncharacterized protein with von Willebrand factor type A (vWA) domain
LKQPGYDLAIEHLSSDPVGWSGGTKIGASLAEFNAAWLDLVDSRTIVILLSDGWDTGEPELLADELARLQQRAGRIVWLNPLLGDPSYRPLTRGVSAALPHVDVFAPLKDLASLRALEPHLRL